jgi:predicted GNAT family acetyltransferase
VGTDKVATPTPDTSNAADGILSPPDDLSSVGTLISPSSPSETNQAADYGEHFNQAVEGAVNMGKSVLMPKGKTEAERIKNIAKSALQDPENEQTIKAGEALNRADEESKTGHPVRAALSRVQAGAIALAGATPLVGPWAASVAESAGTEVGERKYGAAAGDVFGNVAVGKALEKGGELAEDAVGKVVSHVGETAKNVLSGAGEEVGKVATAKAPAGSTEGGFAKIGGKELRAPDSFGRTEGTSFKSAVDAGFDAARKSLGAKEISEPEVTHTGHANSINEVKIKQGGEDIAALHFTHDGDTASVNDTWVDESARGQGNGQRLITEAAAKARANGAKEFTSDPNGETSPAAQHAWDALVRKGDAVETGDETGPKYRMDLTTEPEPSDLSSVGGKPVATSLIDRAEQDFFPETSEPPERGFITRGGRFLDATDTDHFAVSHYYEDQGLEDEDAISQFLNDTSAVRTGTYEGSFLIHHGDSGLTPEQIDATVQAYKKSGADSGVQIFDGSDVKHLPAATSPGGLRRELEEANPQIKSPNADISESQQAATYHPDLQAVADKWGTTDDASVTRKGGAFITPDGKFIDLRGAEHNRAIENATGVVDASKDNRPEFINNTGAIRTRFSKDRAGDTLHLSVPTDGVTDEQVDAIKDAVRTSLGKYGNIVMETADGKKPAEKQFVNANAVEPMLKEIGAHPEQVREAKNGTQVQSENNPARHDEAVNELGKNSDTRGKGEGAGGNVQVSPAEVNTNEKAEDDSNPIATSAQKLNASKGMPKINHEAPALDESRAKALAAEMDTHAHEPNNPAVKKAYDSLIADVKEQWNHAQKDLGIKFEGSEKDPYDSYEAVKKDVDENKRLKIFTGGNPLPADHPLAAIDPKTGLSYNTMFRGVHDLYGHLAGNNDFSEAGEAGATNSHRQMMSKDSVPALLNETEGQVSQFFHGKDKGNFPPQNATTVPEHLLNGNGWHDIAGKSATTEEAGGIDPRTGKSDSTGKGVEIMPELRQPLDHAPTATDFKNFYDQHKDIFDKNPELRVGWDNKSAAPGGHEINVGAVGDEAARVAKKLDQKSAFDIAKGEIIPTGGEGLRTDFPNYPLEERLRDLRGENPSDIKGFEHLSPDVYNHLEPDERAYLDGNKTLQRNVMSQYHRIAPSVPETINAMQAGAALGGWWQRYINIFSDIAGDSKLGAEQIANTIGPSHAEILKQWHAALSGNKSVQDANNLAWHSYADWLDAGRPTDRKSINDIIAKNGAQPKGSGKKGNAAISDTVNKKGKVVSAGLDTTKIFNLVNSPEMKGERPFDGDVFNDDEKNPLMGTTEGARKIPSMGATVAGTGNLNRLVIDAHIRDFYGRATHGGPAAQYIADSAHLRQAAEALGLKGGEGQEQLWGTVLGLKTLLKEGLTPAQAGSKLNADVINGVGKDYAEVIANDPEISAPGGLLDKLKEKYGIGRGSAGVSAANRQAPSTSAGEGKPAGGEAPVNQTLSTKTAERILGQISETKIKKPAATPVQEAPAPRPPKSVVPKVEDKYTLALKAGDAAAKAKRDALMKGVAKLSNPR